LYLLALDLLVFIVFLYVLALDVCWAALENVTKTLAGCEAESRKTSKRNTNAIAKPMLNIGGVVVVVLRFALIIQS
jgi:TRAP-type mannitol/chloroaromatic compound transport system permease small subunit